MFFHWTILDSVMIIIIVYIHNELEIKDTTDTQRSASYFDLHLEIDNGGRVKIKLYFPSSIAIFQHHHRMEFTFQNSYVILELGSSTLIFWTELSCWLKSYSNKGTSLLCWSHRYKNSTVVITIWWTVTKYPYLKW